MSLVRFRAQNHPQQTPKPEVDDRATTWDMFNALNERFSFTLDVAASDHNAKCRRYFTESDDGLAQSWEGARVWCNPPYSNIRPWVEKAWAEWETEDSLWRDRVEIIVMLLPANRTEQKWWQELVEFRRDNETVPLRVEFLAGRPRFDRPGAVIGPKGDRPPFGCCLLIWEG